MIDLNRSKDHRWIFQKNISSSEIITKFIHATHSLNNCADKKIVLEMCKRNGSYKGRTNEGSSNTRGVRTSEMKFYMFGYSLLEKKNSFFFSPRTINRLKDNSTDNLARMALVNLFSIQFPHPFSKTAPCFCIYVGRLILKLLLDERLSKRLYIDEFCYFLPFLEKIDERKYEELINSILEFRELSFSQKEILFHSVPHCDEVFANVFHEVNYYFVRIFKGFGVFDAIADYEYNCGQLHSFRHGNTNTHRTDAIESRSHVSGYIQLNPRLVSAATKLLSEFSCFNSVETCQDELMDDFILDLYQIKPIQYLSCLDKNTFGKQANVNEILSHMVYCSKDGSRDGKEFESSLANVFQLFRQNLNTEIISGSGDTDVLCERRDDCSAKRYFINVDAKTAHHSTSSLNKVRLEGHLAKHNSRYCIVVSSKFASGVQRDIAKSNIVAINASTLANYCLNEFNRSSDGSIDYRLLSTVINCNRGKNITSILNDIMNEYYLSQR